MECKYKFRDKYCTCFSKFCEDLPICDDNCQIYEDFKQYTRKTQECKKLNEDLDAAREFNNKCMEAKNKLYDMWREQLDKSNRLEKECEELEKKLELIPCVDTVLQIGYEAYKKQTKYLLNKNSRYRKTLEKIEEYCNEYCMDDCIGDERLRTFDKCQQCISGDILDIINKAKGDN